MRQITIKELKGLNPNLKIPVLQIREGESVVYEIWETHISEMGDDISVTLPFTIVEDTDTKYIKACDRLRFAKDNGEEDDKILQEIDRLSKIGFSDPDYVENYHSGVEWHYRYGFFMKKVKESKEVTDKEPIKTNNEAVILPEIDSQISIQTSQPTQYIPLLLNIPQEPVTKQVNYIPQIKNNNSLKDEIIKKCYKGLEKPIDSDAKEDILGRWWCVEGLKDFKGGEILIDGLTTFGYPPYLANDDKEEIQLLNEAFVKKTGKKAFE